MHHHQAAREVWAKCRGHGVDPIRVSHSIDLSILALDHRKLEDKFVWRRAVVDVERAGALSADQQEALAVVFTFNKRHAFDVGVQVAIRHGVDQESLLVFGVRLGVISPEAMKLLAQEDVAVPGVGDYEMSARVPGSLAEAARNSRGAVQREQVRHASKVKAATRVLRLSAPHCHFFRARSGGLLTAAFNLATCTSGEITNQGRLKHSVVSGGKLELQELG